MKYRNFSRGFYRKFAKSFFYFIAIFAIPLIFCGCPANLKIIANPDKTFSLEFNSIFGEKLVRALEDLSQISSQFSENSQNIASGEQSQSQNFDLSQIIDTKKIENELNLRYFSQSRVKIQKKSEKTYGFIANTKIKNIAKFPKECLSQEKLPNRKTRVVFSLGADSLRAALLHDEGMLKTFADILMAPLVTGEEMSAEEYKDLLSEIYGEAVAGELLSGKFKIDFVCPDGKILSQEIPIANLLASNKAINFVFEW